MFNWLREWKEIRFQYKDFKEPCESCETLKQQLAIANIEKERLLNRLLEKKDETRPVVDTSNLKPFAPKHVPWSVRQRMLESEDRDTARKRKAVEEGLKGAIVDKISSLEKELKIEDEKVPNG